VHKFLEHSVYIHRAWLIFMYNYVMFLQIFYYNPCIFLHFSSLLVSVARNLEQTVCRHILVLSSHATLSWCSHIATSVAHLVILNIWFVLRRQAINYVWLCLNLSEQIRTIPLFSYVHTAWEFCVLPWSDFMTFFHSAIQFPSCIMKPAVYCFPKISVACN
jgi:hypothetical protein